MNFTAILPYLQIILTSCNIIVFGTIFVRFINKPHDTIEKRVTALEVKQKEIEDSLKQGNDRFRTEASTIEVMQICMLALIDFELTFCAHNNYTHTEDLLKAKNLLQEHLARGKKWQIDD